MVEMTNDASDVMRVAMAEESANWRQLTANGDIVETLAASLGELRAKHASMMADLPKAVADHTAAVAACDVAQRRRNTVIGRIARVAYSRLSPALELLIDAEDRRYRAAQIEVTKARQALARLKWDIECLGSDITQTEAALAPPSPQLMAPEKRSAPAEVEIDDIVFPSAPRAA
jgi:hypothetical protein